MGGGWLKQPKLQLWDFSVGKKIHIVLKSGDKWGWLKHPK